MPGSEAAKLRWRKVTDQPRPNLSMLSTFVDAAETNILNFMNPTKVRRPKNRPNGPLECLSGETKCRAEVVSICPSEAAAARLVGAILLSKTAYVRCSIRRFNLEITASLGDDGIVKLQAVTA